MNNRYTTLFTSLLVPFLASLVFLGAVIFVTVFLRDAWHAITATETVLALKSKVATETLNRERFNRVVARIKEKTEKKNIDWEKLRDPF